MLSSTRLHRLGPYVSVVLFGISLWILHHVLEGYRYSDVLTYLGMLSGGQVLMGLALTAASYVLLTGYDVLALKHIHRPMPYRRVGFASFIGFAFSNTVVDGRRSLSLSLP